MLKELVVLALTVGMVSVPVVSTAQEDPVITYRQKVMQSIGANIGAVSDIMKFSLPYEANIAVHAEQISRAASLIPSAFEEELSEGLTDAKPEIWGDWETFKQYADDLKSASSTLAATAASGDPAAIGAQLKEVGGACKQCHDDFRKPKEESYKN
jgi:cytochrome c556